MSNTNQLIVASGNGFTFSVTEEARELKALALQQASELLVVEDSESKDAAISIAGKLRHLKSSTEKFRKELKEPVLEAGKAIDNCAKNFVAEIDDEIQRLEKDVARYITEQNELLMEQKRREREVQEAAARAIQEAERAKMRAEITQKPEDVAAASEAVDKALDFAIMATESEAIIAPVEADGAAVRTSKPVVKVIDVAALYRAFPHAVELIPRLSVINDLIACGNTKIPGVEVTFETKVTVRAAK